MAEYTYPNGATIQQTPYRAFGYIVLKNVFADGTHIVADWPQNRQWWNMTTMGSMVNISLDAASTPPNLSIPDVVVGDVSTVDDFAQTSGTASYDIVGETHLWCISDDNNNGYLPDSEKWFLASGQSATLPVGTKLFFCQGSLTIDGETKTNPTQIHIKTSETSVTANEDCFGITFV